MRRERFAILGAGRLGGALGRLLARRGLTPGGITCRRLRSARRAVEFIGGGEPMTSNARAVRGASLVIISTPDGTIAPLARALAARHTAWSGVIVAHTSGALSSSVLDPLARLGAGTASLHPLASVPDPQVGMRVLRGARFVVEGAPLALRRVRRLVASLGGIPVTVPGRSKVLHHLISCVLSNDLVALISFGLEGARGLGLSRREAARLYLPLLRGTVDNVERLGPVRALTGPVSRGDLATLRCHRGALGALPSDLRRVHRILAVRSVALALEARTITPQTARRLSRLLARRA
jgi:predicted short-subunit dehydrogenase-like oxidoreductase (DUF2520 family)